MREKETWWFMQCSNNWSLNPSFPSKMFFPHEVVIPAKVWFYNNKHAYAIFSPTKLLALT